MLYKVIWPIWRYIRYSRIGVWCYSQIPKYNRPPALRFKPCELSKVGLTRNFDCVSASLAQVTYKCQSNIHIVRHFLNIRNIFDEAENIESLKKYGHRDEGYHEKFYRHIYEDIGLVKKKYWFPRDITSMWYKHGDLVVSLDRKNHLVAAHSGAVHDMPKNYYLSFSSKSLHETRTISSKIFWVFPESHKQKCSANHKNRSGEEPNPYENPFRIQK